MTDLPSILAGFDPVLSVREANRVRRYGGGYGTLMANLTKHNTEREVQVFLHHEINQRTPRQTVIDRLCGKLLRMQARRKRKELEAHVRSPRK